MRQVITQHAFNEDKDDGWVDFDVSLMVVVRLDRQHVVAQAETEIGLAQRGTEQRDLCYVCEWLFIQAHRRRQTRFVIVTAKCMCCGADGWMVLR